MKNIRRVVKKIIFEHIFYTELLQGRLEHLRFHHGDRQHHRRTRDYIRST
jgi:hypothetical protein